MQRTCFKYLDYNVTDETSPFHVLSRAVSWQPIRFRGLIYSSIQHLSQNPKPSYTHPQAYSLYKEGGCVCMDVRTTGFIEMLSIVP